MKRILSALTLPLLVSACATDPLLLGCYEATQASDFPLGKRMTLDFNTAGIHPDRGRLWAIIPVEDHQGNRDWLVCVYEAGTGRLLSTNSADLLDRQVSCKEPCRVDRWDSY